MSHTFGYNIVGNLSNIIQLLFLLKLFKNSKKEHYEGIAKKTLQSKL